MVEVKICRFLRKTKLIQKGMVKRVRGVCSGSKISPSILNENIADARGVLNNFLPDVWIYSEISKDPASQQGYGISLVAELNNGSYLGIDELFEASEKGVIGDTCAKKLLEEVRNSGYIDSHSQTMILNLMALAEKNIS